MPDSITREELAQAIRDAGVIAILRLSDKLEPVAVVEALHAGGIRVIEFSLTMPTATEAITASSNLNLTGLVIGAGTVVTPNDAQAALDAGAQFLVAPNTNADVITLAHEHGKAAIPGVYTPTEIVHARELGADFVKLFPADNLGPAYVKAILAPLPNTPIIPTGGVNVDNLADYFSAGAAAVAVGSSLVSDALFESGGYEAITQAATRFCDALASARKP